MEENDKASAEIEETRNAYIPVAKRAAILYFVIQDLAGIDSMYQFSLTYFIKLFNQIISKAEKDDDTKKRIQILLADVTTIIYSNVCRGLFNTHKLIFSFTIASKILRDKNKINH